MQFPVAFCQRDASDVSLPAVVNVRGPRSARYVFYVSAEELEM